MQIEIEKAQQEVAAAVDAEITRDGIEHDKDGNRAKAYLYCLETRCPKTGWMVPMAPSWVTSQQRNVVAKLVAEQCRSALYHRSLHPKSRQRKWPRPKMERFRVED